MESLSMEDGKEKTFMEKINIIPGIGIIMAMISGILMATGSLTVKLVDSLSGIEIAIARAIVSSVFILPVVLCRRDSMIPPAGERFPLLMRSVTGFVATILSYSSIKSIPLGDSQSIVFSSPVFVSILGCLLLKEPFGIVQIFAVLAAFIGIFLISRPTFLFPNQTVQTFTSPHDHTIGLIMASCACIGGSFTFIFLRQMPKTPAAVVVFWYATISIFGCSIVSLIAGTYGLPATTAEYFFLLICGLSGLFGQGLLTLALKIEHAGPVSLARSIEMVMAFILQVLILGENVSLFSGIGAFILGIGVISVGLNKWYQSEPKKFKTIFCCHNEPQIEIPT